MRTRVIDTEGLKRSGSGLPPASVAQQTFVGTLTSGISPPILFFSFLLDPPSFQKHPIAAYLDGRTAQRVGQLGRMLQQSGVRHSGSMVGSRSHGAGADTCGRHRVLPDAHLRDEAQAPGGGAIPSAVRRVPMAGQRDGAHSGGILCPQDAFPRPPYTVVSFDGGIVLPLSVRVDGIRPPVVRRHALRLARVRVHDHVSMMTCIVSLFLLCGAKQIGIEGGNQCMFSFNFFSVIRSFPQFCPFALSFLLLPPFSTPLVASATQPTSQNSGTQP